MKQSAEAPKLAVIARGPFKVYYEGDAKAVTAANKVGVFDILPDHADFFSVLIPCDIAIDIDGEPITFSISNGIITVRDNEVMLFVNM